MKNPLDDLIKHFQKMPSIGAKSAQRLAFFILSQPKTWVDSFTDSLKTTRDKVKHCSKCFNITFQDPCTVCADKERDHLTLCVVANPQDMLALEKTGEYKGLYHILGGLISPLDSITPDVLKIKELIDRVKKENFKEIFFAINPTVEGEATILYTTNLLKPFNVKLTRIAYGLPIGGDIDYADELTISKAYEGRVEI